MQIELSNNELEIINKGLELWEREAESSQAFVGMLSAVFCPPEQREKEHEKSILKMEEAKLETIRRKNVVILLRAKIIQTQSRASEHELQPS